jgi:hypothetical protein
VYGCLAHAKRGKSVCDNSLVLPIERVDAAVMETMTRDVLRPAVVRALIDGVFAALKPSKIKSNVAALRNDLRSLEEKIANLTGAIEGGAALPPIVAKLKARQAEREALLASIAGAEAVCQLSLDRQEVERKVLAQVSSWRELLASNGRQFLREAVDGPIGFTPEGKQYRFGGKTVTGRLIGALIGDSTFFGVPKGSASYVRPETRRSVRTGAQWDRAQSGVRSRSQRTRPPARLTGSDDH